MWDFLELRLHHLCFGKMWVASTAVIFQRTNRLEISFGVLIVYSHGARSLDISWWDCVLERFVWDHSWRKSLFFEGVLCNWGERLAYGGYTEIFVIFKHWSTPLLMVEGWYEVELSLLWPIIEGLGLDWVLIVDHRILEGKTVYFSHIIETCGLYGFKRVICELLERLSSILSIHNWIPFQS